MCLYEYEFLFDAGKKAAGIAMFIYAMSDMHGEKEAFEEALSVVDFSGDNILVLCGDYLDHFQLHPEFLSYIKEFQESHEGQVIALMGNHEAMYLEKIDAQSGATPYDEDNLLYGDDPEPILFNDRKTIKWLRKLPLSYETDTQIFVHAGVDEEAGEYWKVGTADEYFYEKHPQTYGPFEKDIIAGHIGTYAMCGENRVFWDGQSHFYIDGSTETSKFVPVLKFDTKTGRYTSFEKADFEAGVQRWSEYVVKPGDGE